MKMFSCRQEFGIQLRPSQTLLVFQYNMSEKCYEDNDSVWIPDLTFMDVLAFYVLTQVII